MKESLVAKALRGFFILLPFLIAYLMAGQLADMLLGLTQPIVDVMPGLVIQSEGMQRLSGAEEESLQPALLAVSPDARILVAVVEPLECSMADALSWPMNWGAGTEALFAKRLDQAPAVAGEART